MCDILVPDSEYLNFKRCGKPVKDYSHKCEIHADWRNHEMRTSENIRKIMRFAFKIYDKAIGYAFTKNYIELEKILDENPTNESDIHDIIAMIAIRSRDEKMLGLTNHHQRKLMDDLASDEELFPFLIDFYAKNGGNSRYDGCWEIPSYVWRNCTLKNAIMLHKITCEDPDLSVCNLEVQEYFGYGKIYTLYMQCAEHKSELDAVKERHTILSLPARAPEYEPPRFKEQQSNEGESPEEIVQVMHAFLYEELKHCLICRPSLFLQKRDGAKISIDKYISYKIYFEDVEYSSIQELKQLDKKCIEKISLLEDGKYGYEDPHDEICECDITCDDHLGSILEHLDNNSKFKSGDSGFTMKCKRYPLKIVFTYDLKLFSMVDIEEFLTKYKCLDIIPNRICSRCKKSGFISTPLLYSDDLYSIYLCIECFTTCYDKGWRKDQIQNVEKISNDIVTVIRQKGLY